ncbi:ATP-binding protein [Streptomyces chitinivorans]|uniref:ATP-binding protein n=1 Tax=Streptomyces chitinivorans TaxID=1257027 RepID=A0ABW7HP52_9ACTN|nr:ATP-binding protein [Streptomyces chitinivorans]MDH2407591.1 ATP-binding protein [Streptomyces chitinivorans]
MKQRTMKTIGVAVLGAAFAATGAGAASAADTLGLGRTAEGAVKSLPVQEVARTLPAPDAPQQARTLPAPAEGKQGQQPGAKQPNTKQHDPVRDLLGGLPLGSPEKPTMLNLPTGQLTGALQTGKLLG